MIWVFLFNTLVYQFGDTLIFVAQDSVVDRWLLGQSVQKVDSLELVIEKRAKVSNDNRFFFIFEMKFSDYGPTQTRIVFYDSQKNKICQETSDSTRTISFSLSNIFDSLFIIVDTGNDGTKPRLWTIKNKKKDMVIDKGSWYRINEYKISPNNRYLVVNTSKAYGMRKWDYIYFVDLQQKTNWQYLYPECLSCKRAKIEIALDDSGQVEVIYIGEHRIFSNDGMMINYFIKPE